MERGRETTLVVASSRAAISKRFSPASQAFRISISRALAFKRPSKATSLTGACSVVTIFKRPCASLPEDEEDDATPRSLADELDTNDEARSALEGMAEIDRHGTTFGNSIRPCSRTWILSRRSGKR